MDTVSDKEVHVSEEILMKPGELEWGTLCGKCFATEERLAVARDKANYNHQVVCQKMVTARLATITAFEAKDMKTFAKEESRLRRLTGVVYQLRLKWLVAEDDLYAARDRTVNCLVHYGIGSRYH